MNAASPSLTLFRREMAAYFNAAIAYIFIIVFVLLNGGLFMTQFFIVNLADMRAFFNTLPFVLAVFLPAVSMRLWAEEKRGNTLELLLTFPMPTHQLVIGKFLASFLFYLVALAATFTIPLMLKFIGHPDMGPIVGGYMGAAMLGAFYLAIGIFISGLCRDQIVSFILSMMICFGLHLIGTEFLATSIDGWIAGFGSFLRFFIGSSEHYESFAKGVIDTRDVLYFVSGTVIFLVLNGLWLEGRMRAGAKQTFATVTAVSLAVFLAANWFLSSLPLGRFDLTEGQIYTVAPASKKILRELDAPVIAKFYISPSDKMPTGMKTLEQEVVDKLDELRISSKGNFSYKIFHMEAANVTESSGKEDSMEAQMQKKGIQPFQVRAIESDQVGVRLVYSAISLAYKDKAEEILPRIMPDNLNDLEYLILAKIYRMKLPEVPKIAIVAPYEEKELDPQIQALLAQLGGGNAPQSQKEDDYELISPALEYEGYITSRIRLSEKEPVPDDVKTLVVFEPKHLSDRQRYEINRFLRKGGAVFLAVQNYTFGYQPTRRSVDVTTHAVEPEINSLLSAWGLGVEEKILFDEQHDVINLSGAAQLGPFQVSIPVKVPTQILITETGMNQDVSITSHLSPLFYLWGSALTIDEAKLKSQNLKLTRLLHSTAGSWTIPYKEGNLAPEDMARPNSAPRGPFPLAIMVEGQFADAYEGKAVPDWPNENPLAPAADAKPETQTPPSAVTPAPGKLILMGAATPFQKSLIRGGGHLNFLLNIIDSLTLGDELVTIRAKQPIDRSLGRIATPAKAAWKIFVIFLIPAVIAAIGAFRVVLRKQAKQRYMKEIALTHV